MKVCILGAGESGIGAALLAQQKAYEVVVSDFGQISDQRKEILTKHNIHFEENGHSLDILESSGLFIKSPGIDNQSSLIRSLVEKGKEVIGEIEFAARYYQGKIIGVTGSNGKTTVCSLIYHIMQNAGKKVKLGGNIGKSFASLLLDDEQADWLILELSSFQLEDVFAFKPDIGLQLNITPDHLDRYDYSLEKYAAAKARLQQNMNAQDMLIYNADDKLIKHSLKDCKAALKGVSFDSAKADLMARFNVVLSEMKLKGLHNYFNSLMAGEACAIAGVHDIDIKKHICSFSPINHRLETVKTHHGVQYINDSKATNIDACKYALMAMNSNTIWIVGGVDKGNDYASIQNLIEEKVKACVFLGIDNEKLIKHFEKTKIPYKEAKSMQEAIDKADAFAEAGDVVLLSPACASFDLFNNYIDRGDQFRTLIESKYR